MNPREWDTRVPFKTIQLPKHQISQPYSRRVQITPPGDSIRITRGLRGYTRWVRSRAPSRESKYPPGRFYLNHRRARGLHPMGALARTLWRIKIPLDDSIRFTRGLRGYTRRVRLLPGTKYWGTQRGGANNHQTLMLLNRQERDYTSCPNDRGITPSCLTSKGWLCLTRRLRADSASPDIRGKALPRSTSKGRLRLT